MQKNMPSIFMILIIISIIILDQVTKYIIKVSMYLGESITVLGDFFRITYVENPGMACGVRLGNPVIFLGLSLFAAGLVFYYLYKLRNKGWPLQLALSFISAGAIGNLVDRFLYGKVVDFLDFDFINISIPAFNFLGFNFTGFYLDRWYVFNIADSSVSVGMIIILLYLAFVGDPLKSSCKASIESSNV